MEKLRKIINIIILVVLIPILIISIVILVNSYIYPDEVPSFLGWKPFIVLSGSMETEIYPGDIAVVKTVNQEELEKDDIIAFKNGDIVVTHRIVEIEETDGQTRYITKGDNNSTNDKDYVYPEQIEGKFQFRVGRLGNLAMFIQTPAGIIICLSIPFILLILNQMSTSQKDKREDSK